MSRMTAARVQAHRDARHLVLVYNFLVCLRSEYDLLYADRNTDYFNPSSRLYAALERMLYEAKVSLSAIHFYSLCSN